MIELKLNPTQKDLRIFAALQMVFFAIVAWLVWRSTRSTMLVSGIIVASTIVGLLGIPVPRSIRWIYVVWMLAVFPIGWVVSHVVLAAVYFGLFTPIGILMRLCGRDPMARGFEPATESYWKTRTEPSDTGRYFRQF